MVSSLRARRLGALAVSLTTALVAGYVASSGGELQPVALPVVFGVALATAIEPRLWLVHLTLVAIGLAAFDMVPDLARGGMDRFSFDLRTSLSALGPAFIGAAMVRLACRSAM
ncbi:hypothetical protein [Prosthecodimorpha staleyi]|uniref:Uncharacterized protein n=1 Tax=Prosthecodimorpha staleyi TaxID=2840188 RepID=A0A947GJR6_9HYPH|nr:hypothetical protein [Prosthecodimorpha staleyi]MBT9292219.1 hypothetical protein [Prosthecodimorpha staleyi]